MLILTDTLLYLLFSLPLPQNHVMLYSSVLLVNPSKRYCLWPTLSAIPSAKNHLLTEHLLYYQRSGWDSFLITLLRSMQLGSLPEWKSASKLSFQHRNTKWNYNLLLGFLSVRLLWPTRVTCSSYSRARGAIVTDVSLSLLLINVSVYSKRRSHCSLIDLDTV